MNRERQFEIVKLEFRNAIERQTLKAGQAHLRKAQLERKLATFEDNQFSGILEKYSDEELEELLNETREKIKALNL